MTFAELRKLITASEPSLSSQPEEEEEEEDAAAAPKEPPLHWASSSELELEVSLKPAPEQSRPTLLAKAASSRFCCSPSGFQQYVPVSVALSCPDCSQKAWSSPAVTP